MLSRVRRWWRSARTAPVAGPVLAALDRFWWARTIGRARIADLDFVALQLGRRTSARSAVRRYVRSGFRSGFSLNPLMDERTISHALSDSDRVPALYAYLVNDRSRLEVSPIWSAVAEADAHPDALDDPAGPLGWAWRHARSDGEIVLGRAGRTRRVAWSDVLNATRTVSGSSPPVASDLLVCVLGEREPDADRMLLLTLDAARAGFAVDLVLTSDDAGLLQQAALTTLAEPLITARTAVLRDVAAPSAVPRDGLTVFRGPNSDISAVDLLALADAGRAGRAAALWLLPDGTVASAGRLPGPRDSFDLLRGHPAEDARRAGAEILVGAVAGPVRAWPRGEGPEGPGRTLTGVVATAPERFETAGTGRGVDVADVGTAVDGVLAASGLLVSSWDADAPVVDRDHRDPATLRWALKTSAPAGTAGESWGDVHFARGLARALTTAGQIVSIDARPAARRPTTHLDDVTVVLRGPHRVVPAATGVRILWIISHPDEITYDEIADYDIVFAASAAWARTVSQRFGRKITPLLQCTDTRRFHPEGHPRTDDIVFVGTARGIARPVVVEPLRAGLPVQVYGPDWTGYIPGAAIVATGIANEELPALYERAGVVLNDHWPAMQREGFVSNRLFDVVAAGGRAISDDVDGIEELFDGAVRVYRSVPELIELLSRDLDSIFPSEDDLARIAERVRESGSFDARARSLIDAARRARTA